MSLPDRTGRSQKFKFHHLQHLRGRLCAVAHHLHENYWVRVVSSCVPVTFSIFKSKENTNVLHGRRNFKCMLLLNSQMSGPPSPRPTRVPGWLNTFFETVMTFDPCQATMRLGHVVEQAHSYLSVSRALARGQLSSQARGRRVHSHGAVLGLADEKKKRKALSTLRCFSFLRWVPLTTA